MGADGRWLIPLSACASLDDDLVGGKAAVLGRLLAHGWRVPSGVVVSTLAYDRFLRHGDLPRVLGMELGRKPLDGMRWEELWDTALRLRSAFLAADIPDDLEAALVDAVRSLGDVDLVVRSSAPGEDGHGTSFAGIHESVVGVRGEAAALAAVRTVWASLWSDAALLYRRELGLDAEHSNMAVLIQPLVPGEVSGVAFARDPRQQNRDVMVVEAVPGLCRDLVDGAVDPDRWILQRDTGQITETRTGDRPSAAGPLLSSADLDVLWRAMLRLEDQLGFPPDVEWTGRGDQLTILQARPITEPRAATPADAADQRPWYLSLRPGDEQLRQLCRRVADELIPALTQEGLAQAAEELATLADADLAAVITARQDRLDHWRRIYRNDFIPFAHGVRRLAVYYNDAVRPQDPYEFLGLLSQEERLATRRNRALQDLAALVRRDQALIEQLSELAARDLPATDLLATMAEVPGAGALRAGLEPLLSDEFDITFDGQRLSDHAGGLLQVVLRLAAAPLARRSEPADARRLEQRLREAVGPRRNPEVDEVLSIARLSWRLRDDDNLLLGRLESQLLRAMALAAERLRTAGRLVVPTDLRIEHAAALAVALSDPGGGPVDLVDTVEAQPSGPTEEPGVSARQLTGQPGAPGLARGPARLVRGAADLARFQAGDVLVCDAIEPAMTHLVPLAAAVLERRGGMLIHGVIIARELGLPSVNGIPQLLQRLPDGAVVTVDGYLGIVTVGEPGLGMELGMAMPSDRPR